MFALAQVNDRIEVHKDWFKDYGFTLVDSIDKLKKLVDICVKSGTASLDLETTGVDNRVYKDEFFNDGIKTRYGMRTIDKVVGVCISFNGVNGYYVPLGHEVEDAGNLPWDEAWDEIDRLCHNARIIFHNAKFDIEFLYPLVGIERWDITKYEDTFLMAKVISPNKVLMPAGLKQLTKKFYGVDMLELDDLFTDENREYLKKTKQGYNFGLLHPKEGLEYGCSDGIFTYKLFGTLGSKLSDSDQVIYRLEKSFCNVVRKMERNRVHIDVERVNQLLVECRNAMTEVGNKIREIIESKSGQTGKWKTLNIGSPKQLSMALITDQEGIKLKPTQEMLGDGENGFSVDPDVLSGPSDDDDDDDDGSQKQFSLKDEVIKSLNIAYGEKLTTRFHGKDITIFDLILEYRHYDKMKGSYIEKLSESHDKYGDVRPSFNQMGTDTARLSCKAGKIKDGYSGINFQGIPRDSDSDKPELFKQIRTVIIPRPGKFLVKIDYAGEELRVVTNMSGDKIWTNSFLNEDGDVHSITARSLFQKDHVSKFERGKGKASNFALIYGGGAGAIQRNIGCSMEDAQRSLANMRKDLPELMGYVEHQKSYAKKHKCVYTAFGRRMPIPTIDSPIKAISRKAERCAINYTIQATSADILKFAMCFVDKKLMEYGWDEVCKYVLTVHDEVVFEIDPEYLMDIVPKLDEWMTLPWKLYKVHGRQWVVPLETEPGVDIHWRARFDFFAMAYGTKPTPKDMDGDKFVGKLKDDQFFENGKIYQKIPDFLSKFIYKTERPLHGEEPKKQIKEEAREVKERKTEEEPRKTEEEPRKTEEEPRKTEEEPRKTEEEPRKTEEEPRKTEEEPFNIDEEEMTTGIKISDEISIDIHDNVSVSVSAEDDMDDNPPNFEIEKPKYDPSVPVFRWSLKAPLSESVMKKLHAVMILAEGNTPIRVLGAKDKIMISEEEGIKVDQEKFKFLTELFGL